MSIEDLLNEINKAVNDKSSSVDEHGSSNHSYVLGMERVQDMVKDYYTKNVVVIPQVVADWLYKCKIKKEGLGNALSLNMPVDVARWMVLSDKNEEVFARAWVEGYEVEKEPLYWVRNNKGSSLMYKDV